MYIKNSIKKIYARIKFLLDYFKLKFQQSKIKNILKIKIYLIVKIYYNLIYFTSYLLFSRRSFDVLIDCARS